jgi:hypothetical protein
MRARLLLALPLLVCSALHAQSQYAAFVANNITDMAGNKLASGTITFRPVLTPTSSLPASPRLTGGGRAIPLPITFKVVAGVASATYGTMQLLDVTQANPANFCYASTIHDNNSGATWNPDPCLQPAYNASWCTVTAGVTSCDYGQYLPSGTPGALVSSGPPGAAGAGYISGLSSNGSNGINVAGAVAANTIASASTFSTWNFAAGYNGAICDGITDDTNAFNALLGVVAAAGGGTVKVIGTCLFNSPQNRPIIIPTDGSGLWAVPINGTCPIPPLVPMDVISGVPQATAAIVDPGYCPVPPTTWSIVAVGTTAHLGTGASFMAGTWLNGGLQSGTFSGGTGYTTTNSNAVSISIVGLGPSFGGGYAGLNAHGPSIMDIRTPALFAKIMALGANNFSLKNIFIKDSGTDCTPFVLATGANADIGGVTFSGTHGNASSCNEGIIFGGTINAALNSPNGAFLGYGTTRVVHNWFDKIRVAGWFRDGTNSILWADNEYESTSGVPSAMPSSPGLTSGFPAYCPIMSDSTVAQTYKNLLRGNLFESVYVPYDICQIGSSVNSIINQGNSVWDTHLVGNIFIAEHFTSGSSTTYECDGCSINSDGNRAIAQLTVSGSSPSITVTGVTLLTPGAGASTTVNSVIQFIANGVSCGYAIATNTAGALSAPVIQVAGPCATTPVAVVVGPNTVYSSHEMNLYNGLGTTTYHGLGNGTVYGSTTFVGNALPSGGAPIIVRPNDPPTSTSADSFIIGNSPYDPTCPGNNLFTQLYTGALALKACTGESYVTFTNSGSTDSFVAGSNGSITETGHSIDITAGTGLAINLHSPLLVVAGNSLNLQSTTTPLLLNSSAGTAGQVMTSAGPGATPTWAAAGSGVTQITGPSGVVTGPTTFTGNGVTQAGSTFTFGSGGWFSGLVEDTGCCTVSTSLLVPNGNIYTTCVSSTSSYGAVSATSPLTAVSLSAATSGDCAGWYGVTPAYFSTGQPILYWTINYVTSADYGNDRIWMGLASPETGGCSYTVIDATDTPTTCAVAAIRFSTSASDTYYTGVTCNGSACTYTPIGVSPATSIVPMSVAINSGSVTFTVNGTSVTSTTTLPPTSALMYSLFLNTTLSNTARYLLLGHIHGVYQSGRAN